MKSIGKSHGATKNGCGVATLGVIGNMKPMGAMKVVVKPINKKLGGKKNKPKIY